MSILEDTKAYEGWLRTQCEVVEKDLARKHERMRKNPFAFLRATYHRWARRGPPTAGDRDPQPLPYA